MEDTTSLRQAAPQWSLAGDKQLLGMLQKIHQKIVTKCEEANVKFDAMVDALDNANIDLQNVNNKFMALNNTQFVESRVYDDDVDILTEGNTVQTEVPEVKVESEILKLKRSLQRLEQMHEPVHILDSDSSDDEDDGRIILKPKETYSHRPLPHIIGTQAWKNKWHAGLLPEESDSDSSTSKPDNIPAEEYSESEPESAPTDKLANRTISSSSSIDSEIAPHSQAPSQNAVQPAKQADIAAELARRLGGQPVHLPVTRPAVIEAPEPTTKKVYRVEKPASSTIFSDEPPPLDEDQSYKSDYSDDDDIFAELNKKPPNTNKDKNFVTKDLFGELNKNVVDELFGESNQQDDIGNVVDDEGVNTGIAQTSSFVGDKLNCTTEKPMPIPKPDQEVNKKTEGSVKKPVGGISLFGSNKGAESIGAAILKRNQRKSSSSDEDKNDVKDNKNEIFNDVKNKAPVNKIIEGLFNKPEKKSTKKGIKWETPEEPKPVKDKIDLFSDNLFDDIDDIFTTNVVTKAKDEKSRKSIFDDDDDDLFADITFTESDRLTNKIDTKGHFDDELLTDNVKSTTTVVKNTSNPDFKGNEFVEKVNNETNIKDEIVEQSENTNATDKSKLVKFNEDNLFSDIKTLSDSDPLPDSIIENIKKGSIRNIEDKSSYISKSMNSTILNSKENTLRNESESRNVINLAIPNSQFQSRSLLGGEKVDDLFSEKTKLIFKESTSKSKKDVVYDNCSENSKSKGDLEHVHVDKGDHLQITVNISETKQNESDRSTKQDCKFVEPHSTFVQDSSSPVDINIPQVKSIMEDSEKLRERDFKTQNEMLAQNKVTRTSLLNESDISVKPTDIKSSEKLFENVSDIAPNNTSASELLTSEAKNPNIFNDLPPDFKKPVEPKRSKNINALFDDDSDDETLFFKKNDGISDEKPNMDYSNDRFSIFHDEPPEIDIDFSQKSSKNRLISVSELSNEDFFAVPPIVQHAIKSDSIDKKQDKIQQNMDLTKKSQPSLEVDITKLIENSTESNNDQALSISKLGDDQEKLNRSYDISEDKNVSVATNLNDKSEVDLENLSNHEISNKIEYCEPKKVIGKLKPMNFSINVNSLLPGAALTKSKISEEIDGQIVSTESNEKLNIHNPEKPEAKVVKSASFEGGPDSKVLDSKLSKQRAKIQVKRRPPSRKARLEAVRKSGIDFSSDSTDNSSSFDETPYKEISNDVTAVEVVTTTTITQKKSTISDTSKENSTMNESNESIHQVEVPLIKSITHEDNLLNTKINSTDVKSKVVYILNDEDIFTDINTRVEETSESKEKKRYKSMIVDDDSYNVESNMSTSSYPNETKYGSYLDVQTNSAKLVSDEIKEKDNKNEKVKSSIGPKSIFEDLSDSEKELFNSNKTTMQKSFIFDSDSDSELFAKNIRENKLAAKIKKKDAVKGSLFGDESDDENDLFKVKAVKLSGNIRQMQKEKETTSQTEPVFEDPLSMFEDDN